jgi:UDP-N-acetyl-D-glucosamine dehydrogenase
LELKEKIRNRQARIGIIGLGYVGLPLAVEFAKAGFRVTGFDVDVAKVSSINKGHSYIGDVSSEDVSAAVKAGKLSATDDMSKLHDMDAIDICVPTPLRKTRDPDLSYVVLAVDAVRARLKPGQLVILESTTYPGTTDEVVQPALEEGGLKAGKDFYLAFSPERVDPGNQTHNTKNIPKVVGGMNDISTELAAELYGSIISTIVPVSSTQVAEMVKLLENTFRMINIGLVNELAMMCGRMNIDVWEVIEAAATKPFGFMPFFPGPGLGGHCIPIDPFYLSWKTKQAGIEARFIELAGHINGQMPLFVVEKVQTALNDQSKAVKGSRIHVLGVAYKKDIDDVRESPALDIIQLLERRGGKMSYSDPHVPYIRFDGLELCSDEAAIGKADCVVIVTDHSGFDYKGLVDKAPLIVDTRNALKGMVSDKIVRL